MKTQLVTTALARSLLFAAFIALAACAPAATPAPTAVPPTAVPPTMVPPTAVPPTAAPAAGPVTLQIVQNATLGKFLADGDGRTLYMFTKDTKDTSNCYDKCATAWPPLLSSGQPTLKDGVDTTLVGSTQRKDGSTQLTYNHWPLYYWASDQKPGDTTGQAVGKVWWVLSGEGNIIRPAALSLATDAKLGKFVADESGFTLYIWTKDSPGASVCYGKCEQAWPPLLTVGQPTVGDGVNASLVGTIQRKDGSTQVTYQGLPLYYYMADLKAGDTAGQGVGSVWYVIGADGTVMK
jgi:predicted lipoprotein with Yx(FWY)xxD motif